MKSLSSTLTMRELDGFQSNKGPANELWRPEEANVILEASGCELHTGGLMLASPAKRMSMSVCCPSH